MAMMIEKHKEEAKVISCQLACALEVVMGLLRIKAKMSEKQYELLRNYVSPVVDSDNETGWEESTMASVQHLISKLKQGKGAQVGVTKMQELTDTTKLKGQLQVLFDKIQEISKTDGLGLLDLSL